MDQHQHQPQAMPQVTSGLVLGDLILRLVKYLIEGTGVALAAWLISGKGKKLNAGEIAMLGLTAGCVFAVLDLFSPAVGAHSRQGAGLGLGAGLVGFGGLKPM
jgi:hypothetical protein